MNRKERPGLRTFQYRNRFDVFGVDIDGRTTAVNTAVVSSTELLLSLNGHTVYNPEWLVVVSQRRVTTNRDLGRTAKTCTGRVHLQTGYFTLQCTGNRRVSGLVQLVTFDFLYGVSQHFLFTFVPKAVTTTSLIIWVSSLMVTFRMLSFAGSTCCLYPI